MLDKDQSLLSQNQQAAIDKLWRRLGMTRAAVRSSGESEDGHERSFAGVFETILNVARQDLEDAVRKVEASFDSSHAAAYAGGRESGGVIVQEMVDAEYSGVLFTQHPSAGGLALVEMVTGSGDKLVAGAVTPVTYRYGRHSGRPIGEKAPPIDLKPLLDLGRRSEKLFGMPQDIEWAYRGGRFHILQSRDIIKPSASTEQAANGERIEAERSRLLSLIGSAAPDDVALAQDELSELVPRPTPVTLSLLESLWRPGGSVDLACRALGCNYTVEEDAPPYLVSAFGGLYVNMLEKRRRARPIGLLAASRLTRFADAIKKGFTESFLPEFLKEVRLLEAVDVDCLSTEELLELFETVRHRFIARTYVQAEIVNIAASFYLDQAKRLLERRQLSPANYLSDIPETVASRTLAALQSVPARERRLESYLEVFGHRAQLDYELACPRYREDPKLAEYLMTSWPAERRERPSYASATIQIWQDWRNKSLATAVTRARRFLALKEDAKHHCLRELAVLRRVLVAIDRRLSLDGRIFYLTLDEVSRLADHGFAEEAAALADRRRDDSELFQRIAGIPAELRLALLETMPLGEEEPLAKFSDDALKGTLVAGSGPVIGRARVVSALDAEKGFGLDDLEEGEIVVSRLIHPQWLPYFPRAAGLICEVGGWLSHTAILAREYNLPMIVGVHGLESIRNGDVLRLHPDGSIERTGDVQEPAGSVLPS